MTAALLPLVLALSQPPAEPAPVDPREPPPPVTPEPAPVTPPAMAPLPPLGPPVDVPQERPGPPYYGEEDMRALRQRHGLPASLPETERPVRWKCLIADPRCGFSVELAATTAFAQRYRQGNVAQGGAFDWSSARSEYMIWLHVPTLVESLGRVKYTRMTLGPRGGVVASDSGDLWGSIGLGTRYWFGRGRWAPSIELTSSLTFKMATRNGEGHVVPTRAPAGFSADIGFGLGGFGAIVVGGQYDSPLAREDVPEQVRVSAGGMVFVGFRGNVLWGAPAVAAVAAHAAVDRTVEQP